MKRPPDSRPLRFAAAILACGVAALVAALLGPPILESPLLPAYGAVVFSAWFGGRAAGLLAVALSAILEMALFLPPVWSPAGGLDGLLLVRIVAFAGICIFLTVFISGTVAARNRVERALQRSRDELEHRVADRTVELSAVIATLRDEIARRQRATEALRLSEESYRTLADNFPSGAVVMFDRDLRLQVAYGVELADVGLARDRIEGKTIFEAYPQEIVAIVEPAYRAALAGERSFLEVPLAGRTYEVHVLPIRTDTGEVAAGMVLTQNITTHKQLEEELRQRTAELEAVFEAIPDLFFRVASDGTIVGYYAASSAEPAVPPHEFLGRRISDVLPDPPASQLADAVAEVFHSGAARVVEYRLPTVQGEGTYEARLWPFPGQQVLAMVRDVTERKRNENAARQSQAQLAHVLRVTTMGEMASGLAHELNQPLQAIVNFATGSIRRVHAGSTSAQDLLKPLQEIATEALRAGEVIRRLRTLLRKEQPTRELVDLKALILEVVQLLESEAQLHRIRLQFDCNRSTPDVLIDRVQIEQVILNLVRNGMESMARVTDGTGELSIQVTCPDPHTTEVAVTDTGEGFPPDLAETIFDPFFTTKSTGIGMGLSISRSIVEAHAGRLWAVSSPGRGTTFRFTLPVDDASAT